MKKISLVLGCACALSAIISSNAGADNKTLPVAQATPGHVRQVPAGWRITLVKGTIKVSPPAPTNPAGYGCGDLSVTATSKEMIQPPPVDGLSLAYPKWQRHGMATGNWANGTCTYQFAVPAKSAFYLSVGWGDHNACDYVAGLTASPANTGPFTLPVGGTKEQNFTLTGTPVCEWIQ